MSTNPNSAVGTNAAHSGRTSVNAFNDDLAAYTSGVLSGWACVPSSGLTLALGGVSGTRDVAVAEDPAGNKTSINNISGSPISVTISAPPASNSRIDAIVAYVDNPPEGTSTTADNPGACGLITVEGTAASTPVPPNDGVIRTAITADGASGSTAYYAVLALVTVASGTTDITSDAIQAGDVAQINSRAIDFSAFHGDPNIPVASFTVNAGAAGTALRIYRIGNICIATGSTTTANWPDGNRVSTTHSVPVGLTPAFEAEILCSFLDGATTNVPASFAIQTDGSILRSKSGAVTQSSRYDYTGVWITHDPWPAS